jgi:hypothetical protein
MRRKAEPLGTDWFVGPDWVGLLRRYQASPSGQTSTPLLDALASGITWCIESISPPVAGAGLEDLRQQLILELLEVALVLEPSTAGPWIPVRLLERARREAFRWSRRQSWPPAEPIDPLMASAHAFEPGVLAKVSPVAASGHLFTKAVDGISYAEQARLLGVSAATIRKRASRERIRLRAKRARSG